MKKFIKGLMKFIMWVIIVIAVFCASVYAGKLLYQVYSKNQPAQEENTNETEEEKIETVVSNIEVKGEEYSKKIYGTSSEKTKLIDDMEFDSDVNFYYKVITDLKTYKKYDDKIDLPLMDESDFKEKCLILVATEEQDEEKENKNEEVNKLIIYEINSDDNTTNIVLTQKEDAEFESESNVYYAIIKKSEIKENINVEVE